MDLDGQDRDVDIEEEIEVDMRDAEIEGRPTFVELHAHARNVGTAHHLDRAFAVGPLHRLADSLPVKEALHRRQERHELVVMALLELARHAELVVDFAPGVIRSGRRQVLPMVLDRRVLVERQQIDRPDQDLAQMLDALRGNLAERFIPIVVPARDVLHPPLLPAASAPRRHSPMSIMTLHDGSAMVALLEKAALNERVARPFSRLRPARWTRARERRKSRPRP